MDGVGAERQTRPRLVGGEEDAAPDAWHEAALVERAKTDPEAFAVLYDRYAPRVYRYCLARLGGREAAEDATGQTFAAALAALPRYRERGTFGGWLFAIAHNAVVDAGRRRARFAPGPPPERADQTPSPEEQVLRAEEGHALRALLAELPPDQRRAVELRLAGLGGAEIAQVLGRSHRAVTMLQFRAMTTLRRRLGADPGPSHQGRQETHDAR